MSETQSVGQPLLQNLSSQKIHLLKQANILFFCVHGLTAVCVAFLTGFLQWDRQVPLYSHLPLARPERSINAWPSDNKQLTTFPVGVFSPIFLALAAANHFACLYWSDTYLKNVSRRRNPIRWFEYAFSASLMHVQISMLCGVFDAHALFLIFGLTVVTMIFGWLAEPDDSPTGEISMRAFWVGFVPYAFQWSVIFCFFFSSVKRADSPPHFVWAIIFVIFFLDLSFGAALYVQLQQRGPFRDAAWSELSFMLLSACAKQLLCWINFGGTQSLPH